MDQTVMYIVGSLREIIFAMKQRGKRFVIHIGMEISVQRIVGGKTMARDNIYAIKQMAQRSVFHTGTE
jgi:hypothetical protein